MDGAKVAEFGDGATIMKANARFMTNGAIELCVYSPATASEKAMRWDLFSPPKPLVPSMPNMPCVDDAA